MIRLFAALLMLSAAPAAERVIVDTDCGYFGDDGTTLAMLLRMPGRVQIDAFTIVSGNVWAADSGRYVREIAALLGAPHLPVHFGANVPLRHTPRMAEQAHFEWGPLEFRGAFGERKPKLPWPRRTAVEELIRRIEAAPGQITLIALGPMTNIAMALQQRPALATRVRRLVFMGGQYRVPGNASKQAEFNFWFDPEAASQVLRSAIPEKWMFGLDVCNRVTLGKPAFDRIAAPATPLARRFRQDFGDRYPGFHKNPTATVPLWDALIAAWYAQPQLFPTPETLWLDVHTGFDPSYGKVIPLDRKTAPHATPVRMFDRVDAAGVLEIFHDLLTR